MYRAWYGDGLGSTIAGLFTRLAPNVAPTAKQLSMKAIDVIRDKGISAMGDLAGKALSAAKDKLASLVRRKKQTSLMASPLMTSSMTKSLPLRSTTVMPANVSKVINNAVGKKN